VGTKKKPDEMNVLRKKQMEQKGRKESFETNAFQDGDGRCRTASIFSLLFSCMFVRVSETKLIWFA
jgi:hypothetical protein